MNFLVQLAITQVIKWASGLTREDWQHFVAKVSDAQFIHKNSADRKQWVIEQVKRIFPRLADWAINLLIELAVAKLRKEAP